jgi:alpha-ketoglutarate-dependent taurine dioxygenase
MIASLRGTVQTSEELGALPVVVRPNGAGVDLSEWAASHRGAVEAMLQHRGAILFRDFGIASAQAFGRVARAISPTLESYVYRSTPRTAKGDGVYTATEYPPRSTIPLHCENAYQRTWPLKLFFFCQVAPAEGGQTPLASVLRVTEAIPGALLEKFADRGVLYVRNYGGGLDLPWETVFQTRDRAQVEQFCRAHQIQFEWIGPDRLRTRQRCQGLATHPRTGQQVWFNQAHLFHPSALDAKTRAALESICSAEDLPRNAFFGDGGMIPLEDLEAIRAAFDRASVCFDWMPGDLLLVDNMLVAHGRKPFKGPREVLVAMAEASSLDEKAG